MFSEDLPWQLRAQLYRTLPLLLLSQSKPMLPRTLPMSEAAFAGLRSLEAKGVPLHQKQQQLGAQV